MKLSQSQHNRRGFSLVELVIVIGVLAIIAALVIPKFSNATTTARANGTITALREIRTQLQLYQTHHNAYPTLAQLQASWGVLVRKTTQAGVIDDAGSYGPYLKGLPVNAFTNSTSVAAYGQGTASDGWEYDAATGTVRPVGVNESTGEYTAP